MKTRRIIMADPELYYILKLQIKFLKEIQDAYEIDVITDREYFEDCFSSPQNAECLIISENWASSGLSKHNIDHIVVLTSGSDTESDTALSRTRIPKYTSTDEIYIQVRNLLGSELATGKIPNKEGSVILFHSASGGTGKTVLSLGLAEYLSQKYYRVLYVNTQSAQSFQYYLEDKTPISTNTAIALLDPDNNVYKLLREQFREERFCYLPPFAMPMFSYGIQSKIYTQLIKRAKESNAFDYIIVDTGSELDQETAEEIAIADKVVMVLMQGAEYRFALKEMLRKLNIKNDKLIRLCNRVANTPLKNISADNDVEITECISEWIKEIDHKTIHDFAASDDIKKMAVLLG